MAQKTIQEQVQTQSQQLSTLQVALSSLLELPIAKLAERIRNEMLDNAALEEQESDDMDTSYEESERIDSDPRDEISEALDDYLSADDIPSYLQERADASAEHKEIPLTSGTSIYDDLVRQIGEHDLTSHERILINYLIGSLDENGFLRGNIADIVDELAIYHNITTSTNELIHILKILQTFEPRGIGAQNLQECLRLQLIDPDYHSPYKDLALTVIDTYFKEFTSKRWDIIVNRLKISKETASHVRHELTHLNPRPGNSLGSGEEHYTPTIIPDFYVKINSDGLPIVTLNTGDVPTLRISPAFHDSISQYSNQREHLSREQHDVYIYARQKVDAAQTFIALINRRQQTLFGVMEAIVRLQNLFFTQNDDEALLRPMTLREVATIVGIDISTVSRVTTSKYVQTDFGVYPLKFFFSSQFTTESGDELSARQVRSTLKEIIDAENKQSPFSDEKLTEILAQRGFDVARRTVTKYREQMNIPTSRLRRE